MTDCIFCKIVAGVLPSKTLYKDEEIVAFRDIHPLAPTHILIVPRKHIPDLAQVQASEVTLIGRMVQVANQMAKQEGIAGRGYRIVINSGKEGGQIVPHLHMHLLGGKELSGKLG
jgi:histidine triad (HIT) family protein